MAGSATKATAWHGDKYVETIVWTSDSSGDMNAVTTGPVTGFYLYQMATIPGTSGDAPSADYDITITDTNGVDMLGGNGANRSATAKEITYPAAGAAVSTGAWTITVDNAGDTNKGTIVLYYVGGNKA